MSEADDSQVVVVLLAIFHACLHLSPIVHHIQHLVEEGKLRGRCRWGRGAAKCHLSWRERRASIRLYVLITRRTQKHHFNLN